MKVTRLALRNIGPFADATLQFVDRDGGGVLDVAIVTGGPASGKTTVLEAIIAAKETAGPYGSAPDCRHLLRSGTEQGSIQITWWLSPAEVAHLGLREATVVTRVNIDRERVRHEGTSPIRSLLSQYSLDPTQGKVEYFADTRDFTFGSWRPAGPAGSMKHEAGMRLGRDPEKYASILQAIVDVGVERGLVVASAMDTSGLALGAGMPDVTAPLRTMIASLLPHLRLADVRRDSRGELRVWLERGDGTEVELSRLSASERQGVIFAASFWHLGLSRSLVLIDTPELHIHPDAQPAFMRAIASLGADNQIIATTTSPVLIGAASSAQLITL